MDCSELYVKLFLCLVVFSLVLYSFILAGLIGGLCYLTIELLWHPVTHYFFNTILTQGQNKATVLQALCKR